ncbi:hypothetical protein GQ42DRAFT_28376 [Ramicandelaber brevisporus]|nr:hypothetical protein GQ42DRAFT_28376 [Ramicandelaber brevisporus]
MLYAASQAHKQEKSKGGKWQATSGKWQVAGVASSMVVDKLDKRWKQSVVQSDHETNGRKKKKTSSAKTGPEIPQKQKQKQKQQESREEGIVRVQHSDESNTHTV